VAEAEEQPFRPAWVVVLTWNGREVVRACLDSLRPAIESGHRVVVVDNGSADGTADLVRTAFPSLELIETGANLGFAAGNNVGIRHALAKGAELVVLLNQDATVAPDCIDELVAASARHPDAGTVSAKVYEMREPERLWFAGATFTTRTGRSRHVGQGEIDRGQFDREREIDRGCACAMLLTRRMLDEVGLLDEELFLYCEEIDLALRERKRGFLDLLAPRAHAWHRIANCADMPRRSDRYYYQTRNLLHLLDRDAPLRGELQRLTRRVSVMLEMLAELRAERAGRGSALRGIFDGSRDAARGRLGERPRSGSRGASHKNRDRR
jgi:GT2 family glycosyltransferase